MKTLYLVRHAKSSWKYPDLSDFERPLNSRGRNDAPRMAKRLQDMQVYPDIILSSPANRAATTARIFAEIIGYPLSEIQYCDLIYEASTEGLYEIVTGIDDKHSCVMIVGHNPAMTFFVNSLSNNAVTNLPTCAVYALDLPNIPWNEIREDSGKMKFFEFPKK